MSSWYAVLIANNRHDLKHAVEDAKLVERALLRCGFCTAEQLWPIHDQPGDVIKETLEDVAKKVPKDGQLFVWYSGHAFGREMGSRGQGVKGTLLVGNEEELLDDNGEVVCKTSCVWLEDTLFGILARQELRVWCVVAACRGRKAELERGWSKEGHHCKIVFDVPEYDNNWQMVSNQGLKRFAFLYSCAFGQLMWDTSIFAKCFCYNLERCPAPLLATLHEFLTTDSELMTFGEVSPPQMVGEPRSILIGIRPPVVQTQMLAYTPDKLEALKPLKLVAVHLHQLADDETFGFSECAEELDDYSFYEDVRLLAWDIIQSLKHCARDFRRLKDQVWLLSCRSLEEVKDVLAEHQAASSSAGGYPSRPSDWEPDEEDMSDEEYELSQDQRVVLNLPDDVVAAISRALSMAQSKEELFGEEEREAFPSEIFLDMLRMLGGYFTVKKYELEESLQQNKHTYFFASSGGTEVTLEDAEQVEKMLRKHCDKLCMVPEELEAIQEQMRIYVGQSSFWVVVVSPTALKVQSLSWILEDFVKERKCTSFAWLTADAPREVPHCAAPGFEKLIDLVEGLGGAVEVPSLVPLKGSFFKGLAMQLMEKQGETTERWQLRVVSNYRDVNEDQWLNSQQNVDFHFVRCFNWMMAGWKTPELLEHLLRFAAESTEGPEGLSAPESVDELPRPRSVLCALGCLLHAIQDDPSRLGLSIDTIMQVLRSTTEPAEVLKKLVVEVYKIGLTRSTTAADTVVPKTGLTSSGRWCWSHSKFAVLGQTAAKMNPLRWSKRMTVSELAEDLGKYLQTDPRGVKILFDEENEKSYSDQVAAVLELQDMIRKAHGAAAQTGAEIDEEGRSAEGLAEGGSQMPLYEVVEQGHSEVEQRLIDSIPSLEVAEVEVSLLSGRAVRCKAETSSTICELREEAQSKLGTIIKQLFLSSSGQPLRLQHALKEHLTLKDAGVTHGASLTALVASLLDVSDQTVPLGIQICNACDTVALLLRDEVAKGDALKLCCAQAQQEDSPELLKASIFGLMQPEEMKEFLQAPDHRLWLKIKSDTERFIELLKDPKTVPYSAEEMTPEPFNERVRTMRPVVMDQSVREPATNTPFGHTGYMKYLTLKIVQAMGFKDIAITGQYYGSSYTPETQILEWMCYKGDSMDGMIAMFSPGQADRTAGINAIREFKIPNAFLDLTMKASVRFAQSDFVQSVVDTVEKIDEIYTEMGLDPCPWREDSKVNARPGRGEISLNLVDLMEFLNLSINGDMDDVKEQEAANAFSTWKACDAFRRRVVAILTEEGRGCADYRDYGRLVGWLRKHFPEHEHYRILVHAHGGHSNVQDAASVEAALQGANGVWAAIIPQASQAGHNSSLVFLDNILQLGNSHVLEDFWLHQASECARHVYFLNFNTYKIQDDCPIWGMGGLMRLTHSAFSRVSGESWRHRRGEYFNVWSDEESLELKRAAESDLHLQMEVASLRQAERGGEYRISPLVSDVETWRHRLSEAGATQRKERVDDYLHEVRALGFALMNAGIRVNINEAATLRKLVDIARRNKARDLRCPKVANYLKAQQHQGLTE